MSYISSSFESMLLVDILLGGFQFGCEVKLTADGVDYRVPCGLRCDYDRMEESNKPRNCNHHFPCLFANRVLFSQSRLPLISSLYSQECTIS
jgi:hypothetical protein